jgi:putative ABC transport system permease protein
MLLENFLLALKSLWANKMRSFLTTLGIVIGVSAVIGVVSIVQGLSKVITSEVENLGSNTIFISPKRPPGPEGDELGRVELTWEDGQALLRTCPSLETITPVLQSFGEVKYKDQSSGYGMAGVQPVFQDVRNYYVETGRFFAAVDERERMRVTVIGDGLRKELKLPENPLGTELLIKNVAFRIIGVMEPKGKLLGQEFDKFLMIPYGTAISMFGDRASKQVLLLARAHSADDVERAIAEVEDALRVRHRLALDQPNDFDVESQQEFLKAFSKISNGITYVVAGVVSIALLVGGIGIMNIMLVSVTERTREIGVRKAVGARRVNIMAQFIIEAIALALTGGAVGVLLGFGVGALAASLIPNWPGSFVPMWAVILSFGFSSAVGLFFGIYPAAKAARLDPIESLRYE